MKKTIIIGAFSLILFIEIFFRVFYYEQLKLRKQPDIYRPHPVWHYERIPNAESNICLPSIEKNVKINSLGMHNPEFSKTKKQGTFRITIIDASTGEGVWLDGQNSKYYTLILQDLINKEYDNVEVVNCSIGGFGNKYILYLFAKHNIIDFNPDLVLLASDLTMDYWIMQKDNYKGYLLRYPLGKPEVKEYCKSQVDLVLENKFLTSLFDASFIFRAFCRATIKENVPHNAWYKRVIEIYRKNEAKSFEEPVYYLSHKATIDTLQNFERTLNQAGAKFAIFNHNRSDSFEIDAAGFNLTALNLKLYPKDYDEPVYHSHDGHPNQKGHEILAQQFFARLKEKNLLPELYKKKL